MVAAAAGRDTFAHKDVAVYSQRLFYQSLAAYGSIWFEVLLSTNQQLLAA